MPTTNTPTVDQVNNKLFIESNLLLSEKIRYAWQVLHDTEQYTKKQQLMSYHYLMFVFDIQDFEHPNKQLRDKMADCFQHWQANPEYIPNKTPYFIALDESKRIISPTTSVNTHSDPTVHRLMGDMELIDVNAHDKVRDKKNPRITYLTEQKRAAHRVLISHTNLSGHPTKKAHFYNLDGTLYSTTQMQAHGKQRFAAFTLNANGELSIFNHNCGRDGIVHASMNAGAPVVSAGELVIRDGVLLGINTFSGHYRPSLYNQLRVLDHFSQRGVDLSRTKVLTYLNPENELHLKPGSLNTKHFHQARKESQYATPALKLLTPYQQLIKKQMKQFEKECKRKLKLSTRHRCNLFVEWVQQKNIKPARNWLHINQTDTIQRVQKKDEAASREHSERT